MPIYDSEYYEREYGDMIERYRLATDCATSGYERLIHDEPTWRFLQSTFYELTTGKYSYHHRTLARHKHLPYSGIPHNLVTVQNDADRGRAIVATRDIPKGTRLWYYDKKHRINNGYWSKPEELLEFLTRLPHDLQCDILLWAYAAESKKETLVDCNLDEASFYNHGERPELVNLSRDSVATRDILKGEEILMDYSSFIAQGDKALPWWDEMRKRAWSFDSFETNKSDSTKASLCESGDPDCLLEDYVKYGAPKPLSAHGTRQQGTASILVDAVEMKGGFHRHQSASILSDSAFWAILVAVFFLCNLLFTGKRQRRRPFHRNRLVPYQNR